MRLGTKAMTLNIAEKVENDDSFAKSVVDAIKRFQHEDFGDLSEEDMYLSKHWDELDLEHCAIHGSLCLELQKQGHVSR